MYTSGDSVFRYQDGTFVLIYDFGVQTGDSWTIRGNEDYLCHEFATQNTDIISVESIDNEQFGDYEFDVMNIAQNEHWSLGDKIIRGIGSTTNMFPQHAECGGVVDGGVGLLERLDCYYNDVLGFVGIDADTQFCFDLITNNETVIQAEYGAIFPNPTSAIICFSNNYANKNLHIKIFDTQGKLYLNQENITENIDVRHLPSGVYLVNILDENKVIFTQKMVKM